VETDSRLTGVADSAFDLVLFRGAFFFPSMYRVHFGEIARVLKPGGVAIVGGGFGKYTPETILRQIGRKSRELNLAIGKMEISENRLREEMARSTIQGRFTITTEGGLWAILEKPL
jgi:ubiquinone/menaquinone biosynthesis C-methylase UbiE